MNCIIMSNFEKDVYYEFSPNTTPLYEDAWGKSFRGICHNASVSKEVRIYEININHRLSEHTLRRIITMSHFNYSHSNVIPIIDFVVDFDEIHADNCRLYFIEEYVSGISLSNFLDGKIDASEDNAFKDMFSMFQRNRVTFVRKVVKDILQGLVSLHELGLFLGYVDMESIIITNDGNVRIGIKNCYMYDILLDYDDIFTSGWGTLITLFPICYCSPEMMFESSKINCRSDIYSVGILFFHMLTGHLPFQGSTYDIMHQQLYGKMPLSEMKDKYLRKLIKKATEKDPNKRFQSAIEFIIALEDSKKE